ncbi:signal peptide peptidase SppA [Candidatus Micrarchaeota archaeon]|nr:signal peptide peptidase SppA [Candidatus Micrarchaeota archaeon]
MHNKPARSRLILETGLLLVAVFLAIVAMFFVFSAFSTNLVGKCVAVVDVNVPLTIEGAPPSLFDGGMPGSEEYAGIIRSLNKRDDVGAVVFVFNSPGGSVVATREIYNAVRELDKPSVSYFREVAASGAYYVASGTDYIVSDPNALTGSMGAIATVTSMSGLFEKLGINVTTVTSGRHKDIGSAFRNVTEDEREILQALIDEVYQEFRTVVLENRRAALNQEKFAEVSDGRILSGRQAKEAGLVDQLGSKRDAIMKAAELAGIDAESIDDIRVCPIQTRGSEGGLFSVESIARYFGTQNPAISYK